MLNLPQQMSLTVETKPLLELKCRLCGRHFETAYRYWLILKQELNLRITCINININMITTILSTWLNKSLTYIMRNQKIGYDLN